MNRKKSIFFMLAGAALPILSQAQSQQWTLDQCLDYVTQQNIQVKQAELQTEQANVNLRESKAALFPSLTFSSGVQWGFQDVSSQDVATNVYQVKNPTITGSYNLSANVTLYDGGSNWNTIKKNKLAQQGNQYQYESTLNSVQESTIKAYYQVLYAHESVLTNEAILETAKRQLERSRELLKVGQVSKVEVAQMESQYQLNEYQLVNARNTEAANILTLKQLLQLDSSADFQIPFNTFSDADVLKLPMPLADAQQLAQNYLPDMKLAQNEVDQARLQEKIAKAGYAPTLSLQAGVSTTNGNTYTGNFTEQVKDHIRETIGLSLSVPIWDGRRTRSAVDRAKISTANSVYAQESTLLNLNNTIANLHLDILSSQSRYESAVKSEAAAQESYDIMQERFNTGLESVVDLLVEKNQLLSAKQETLQSKYMALLNLRLMDFYTGQ